MPAFLWCHQESNRGHTDFQSVALPTELWHQGTIDFWCCKSIYFFKISKKFYLH